MRRQSEWPIRADDQSSSSGRVRLGRVWFIPRIFFQKRRTHVWSIKQSLFTKPFSRMSVIFRDESNEPSSIMIGYSDATITISNHPPIMRSKTLLATTYATVQ